MISDQLAMDSVKYEDKAAIIASLQIFVERNLLRASHLRDALRDANRIFTFSNDPTSLLQAAFFSIAISSIGSNLMNPVLARRLTSKFRLVIEDLKLNYDEVVDLGMAEPLLRQILDQRISYQQIDGTEIEALLVRAWAVRENAHLVGKTAVGCSLRTSSGLFFDGCNVEHVSRCHDIHAEVNAITTMVANGATDLQMIAVVANRNFFTPCGGCLDWIFQFGGAMCLVIQQSAPGSDYRSFRANELMPHYPS